MRKITTESRSVTTSLARDSPGVSINRGGATEASKGQSTCGKAQRSGGRGVDHGR